MVFLLFAIWEFKKSQRFPFNVAIIKDYTVQNTYPTMGTAANSATLTVKQLEKNRSKVLVAVQ